MSLSNPLSFVLAPPRHVQQLLVYNSRDTPQDPRPRYYNTIICFLYKESTCY